MPQSRRKPAAKKTRAPRPGVAIAKVREILEALPEVTNGLHYGYPSFMVGKQFLGRFRDDDTVLVVHLRSFPERDFLMDEDPDAFFTTDHYRNYPTVLVRLARVREQMLRDVVSDAHARITLKRRRTAGR